jgi:S1-C subfamily serine protease
MELQAGGRITHARMGIGAQTLGATEATLFGVRRGLLVDSVAVRSGAARAGLRDASSGVADVIVGIDDRPTKRFADLVGYINLKTEGDRVALEVSRDGNIIRLTVKLQSLATAG